MRGMADRWMRPHLRTTHKTTTHPTDTRTHLHIRLGLVVVAVLKIVLLLVPHGSPLRCYLVRSCMGWGLMEKPPQPAAIGTQSISNRASACPIRLRLADGLGQHTAISTINVHNQTRRTFLVVHPRMPRGSLSSLLQKAPPSTNNGSATPGRLAACVVVGAWFVDRKG